MYANCHECLLMQTNDEGAFWIQYISTMVTEIQLLLILSTNFAISWQFTEVIIESSQKNKIE